MCIALYKSTNRANRKKGEYKMKQAWNFLKDAVKGLNELKNGEFETRSISSETVENLKYWQYLDDLSSSASRARAKRLRGRRSSLRGQA